MKHGLKRVSVFAIVTAGLLFLGCHSTKKIVDTKPQVVDLSTVLNTLDTAYQMPSWFSCRAKINYDSKYERFQFTSYIRMRTDSVIWFNARKLGIEVMRGLITKDSVFLLDRFSNIYIREGISYMSSKYHLPLDFRGFQKLVVGHPDTLHNDMLLEQDSNHYVLSNSRGHQSLRLNLNGRNLNLENSYWLDLLNGQSLSARYGNHQRINGYLIPLKRNIRANGSDFDDFDLDITFANVEFDTAKKIKFEIPAHYERFRP